MESNHLLPTQTLAGSAEESNLKVGPSSLAPSSSQSFWQGCGDLNTEVQIWSLAVYQLAYTPTEKIWWTRAGSNR